MRRDGEVRRVKNLPTVVHESFSLPPLRWRKLKDFESYLSQSDPLSIRGEQKNERMSSGKAKNRENISVSKPFAFPDMSIKVLCETFVERILFPSIGEDTKPVKRCFL